MSFSPLVKFGKIPVQNLLGHLVAYSSLSNKRDDHDTFTTPKVTLITLLLASITHTRAQIFQIQGSKFEIVTEMITYRFKNP